MDSISVELNQNVTQGQQLGIMGKTGGDFTTHLHLSIFPSGTRLSDIDTVRKTYNKSLANASPAFYLSYINGGAWPTNTHVSGSPGQTYTKNGIFWRVHEGLDLSGRNFITNWNSNNNLNNWNIMRGF